MRAREGKRIDAIVKRKKNVTKRKPFELILGQEGKRGQDRR